MKTAFEKQFLFDQKHLEMLYLVYHCIFRLLNLFLVRIRLVSRRFVYREKLTFYIYPLCL